MKWMILVRSLGTKHVWTCGNEANSIALSKTNVKFYDANNSREKRKIIYGSWISGGSTIITSVLQILNVYHYKFSMQQAVNATTTSGYLI
jgi:gamma-glutamyltranspeptidase